MKELGLDVATIAPWFAAEHHTPYVLVRVREAHVAGWAQLLGAPLRRCYIADTLLEQRAQATSRPRAEILAAALPDRGSTMAGDFGEILVFLYHAAVELGAELLGPKKWRLKQDRKKPAPYSDVVHVVLPDWPQASEHDRVLCSEVKTKSTAGNSSPIKAAITDCAKDRTSRLARTLVWLKECALKEDLGSVTVDQLERFINAVDYPPAKKEFRAVAVVCASLVADELDDTPEEAPADYTVVVIAVPNLQQRYEEVFDAIHATVGQPGASP